MIRPQASSLLLPLRGCLQVSGQLLSPRESLPFLICPYMTPPKNVILERVTVPEQEFHSVRNLATVPHHGRTATRFGMK